MFKYLSLLRYLPILLSIIPHVEALFGAKEGEAKKAAVIGLTVAVLNAAGMNVKPAQLQALSELVDEIVGTFNRLGVFHKDGDAAPAAETVTLEVGDVKVELPKDIVTVSQDAVKPVANKASDALEAVAREARLAELESILTQAVVK